MHGVESKIRMLNRDHSALEHVGTYNKRKLQYAGKQVDKVQKMQKLVVAISMKKKPSIIFVHLIHSTKNK